MKVLLSLICVVFTFTSAAKQLKIVGPNEAQLPINLLHAVAKRLQLDVHYPYPDLSKGTLSQDRMVADVNSGQLSVMWSMTSNELEQLLQPIRIPIYRGLLALRVPLVKAENKEKFRWVTSFNEFKQFEAGSGNYWPDTEILKTNGIPVVTTLKYVNLFSMLEGGRFDYFPRGINEPWSEIQNNPELNLVVDPYILIRYRSPVYFFTKKGDPLAIKIERELEAMIASGEFEDLFFNDPDVREALDKSNIKQRVTFDLRNPNLSSETPVDRQELWFNPTK